MKVSLKAMYLIFCKGRSTPTGESEILVLPEERKGTPDPKQDLLTIFVKKIRLLLRILSLKKANCPGRCGEVRGSADGLFPPGMSKTSDIIAIFSTDLCR